MPRDYYEVLSVAKDASEADIRKSYRDLARKYHPDRNPGDKEAEQHFKEIQEAYDVLGDKEKRAQYDRFGFAGPQQGPGGGSTFHWGGAGHGGDYQEMDPEQAQEFFSQIFGGGGGGFSDLFGQRGAGGAAGAGRTRGRRGPRPREAVTAEMAVPFRTAALGGPIQMKVGDKEIDVKIPPGINEGQTIRLQGQGPQGADLHIKLHIEPDPIFKREGNDIILAVPLAISEAILGAKIDVPTLDGTILTVKVPAGTSGGARLRLRGKGIKEGDQFLEFKIVVPAATDDRSKEIIQEFARLNPQNPREGKPWS